MSPNHFVTRNVAFFIAFSVAKTGFRCHKAITGRILKGEHKANMIASLAMARRPDPEKPDVLSEEELKQLRYNLAHLSPIGVRDFYERAFEDCRLIYNRLPSPRKIQTLVQVWKQLWKWR
jgi:hypothetical protein